ncbi:MAG: hypothetical protein R2709_11800 [Marmoricola sp.]
MSLTCADVIASWSPRPRFARSITGRKQPPDRRGTAGYRLAGSTYRRGALRPLKRPYVGSAIAVVHETLSQNFEEWVDFDAGGDWLTRLVTARRYT